MMHKFLEVPEHSVWVRIGLFGLLALFISSSSLDLALADCASIAKQTHEDDLRTTAALTEYVDVAAAMSKISSQTEKIERGLSVNAKATDAIRRQTVSLEKAKTENCFGQKSAEWEAILNALKTRLLELDKEREFITRFGQLTQQVTPTRTPAFAEGHFEDGAEANKRGDYAKALEIWRPLAEQGNTKAQFALGVMYEMGRGVPQSASESIKWSRRAAEQGDIGAQFALGSAYMAGTGVNKDYVEAMKWERRAAEQGDTISQLSLGGAYAQGRGVQKDLVEALKWLIIAANQNLLKQQSEKNRDMVASVMTPKQIVEAKSRAAQWKPKKEIEPN